MHPGAPRATVNKHHNGFATRANRAPTTAHPQGTECRKPSCTTHSINTSSRQSYLGTTIGNTSATPEQANSSNSTHARCAARTQLDTTRTRRHHDPQSTTNRPRPPHSAHHALAKHATHGSTPHTSHTTNHSAHNRPPAPTRPGHTHHNNTTFTTSHAEKSLRQHRRRTDLMRMRMRNACCHALCRPAL